MENQSVATKPVKSKKKKILIVVSATVILLLAVVAVLVIPSASLWNTGKQIEPTVKQFVNFMANNDLDGACGLMGEGVSNQVNFQRCKTALPGLQDSFVGIKDVQLTGVRVEKKTGEVTMYTYGGKVLYTDGRFGFINFTVIKMSDEWRIKTVEVI